MLTTILITYFSIVVFNYVISLSGVLFPHFKSIKKEKVWENYFWISTVVLLISLMLLLIGIMFYALIVNGGVILKC